MQPVTLGISRLIVVGESNYQRKIKAAARKAGVDPLYAELVAEPRNKFDRNAVRVDLLVGNKSYTVGYLPRADAALYQASVLEAKRARQRVVLPARIFGGTREKPSLGVWIGEQYA